MREEWKGFTTGEWAKEVNVRDFIQKNYTPYDGDESFLAGPTERSLKIKKSLKKLKPTTKKLVSQWILVRHQSQIFLPAIFQKTTN